VESERAGQPFRFINSSFDLIFTARQDVIRMPGKEIEQKEFPAYE